MLFNASNLIQMRLQRRYCWWQNIFALEKSFQMTWLIGLRELLKPQWRSALKKKKNKPSCMSWVFGS